MKVFNAKFHDVKFKTCYITDEKEASIICKKLLDNPQSLYGLDIETFKNENYLEHKKAGLCPHMSGIRLLQIYDGVENVYVFDLYSVPLSSISSVLQSKRFVAHNAIFEIKHLTHAGYSDLNVGCSMLMDILVYNAEHSPFEPEDTEDEEVDVPKGKRSYHSLRAVVKRYYDIWISKDQQVSDWNKKVLTNDQLQYAGLDAVLTYNLSQVLSKKIVAYKMEKAYKLLKDMQHVVAEMELTGFPVDWEAHKALMTRWEVELKKADEKCKPFFGITNLNSSKQMGEWALKNLTQTQLDAWPKTEKGALTFTRTKIFEFKKIPAIEALLEYKKYAKLISTYGISLAEQKHPVTGRLHSSFFIGQTRTGRMSSRDPNLQNMPKDTKDIGWSIRSIFKTGENRQLVVADLAQIEIKIGAYLSKDSVMNRAFEKGIDLHKYIVHVLSGKAYDKVDSQERFLGKAINFGLMFGMGGKKLKDYAAMSYDVHLTEQQAWDAYNAYHDTYKGYSSWCDRQREMCKKLGFARTPMGKMRRLLDDENYTKAVNTPVQGGAAEVIMLAMIKLKDLIKPYPIKIVSVVHDEIILETFTELVPEAKKALEYSMQWGLTQLFPDAHLHGIAECGSADNWKGAKQ